MSSASNGAPTPLGSSRPTLVYIVGTGRCGSTLLDIMLGAQPNIQSTGELNKFAGHPEGLPQTCSCGKLVEACPFWNGVTSRIGGAAALHELRAGRRFEGTKGMMSGMLRGRFRRSRVRHHAQALGTLVSAIAAESQKPIVVDSSKSLGRGYLYSLLRPSEADVRYIHVVRDGRAFLWSKTARPDGEASGKRAPKKSIGRWSALWAVTNFTASTVFPRRARPYLRIRYEDLTARPAETIETVGRFVGVDLSGLVRMVQAGEPLPISHVVGGNRLRFSQKLTLRSDVEWERSLPAGDRRTFWRVAGWLARRYGYTKGSGSPPPRAVPVPS